MNAKHISEKFPSGNIGEQEAISYLQEAALYDKLLTIAKAQGDRIKPKFRDLARLHYIALERKCFTIVEFGVGFSTLILADALHKNKVGWDSLARQIDIRNPSPFKLHSVDSSRQWIEATKDILSDELKDRVEFYDVSLKADRFNGRICHFYEQLPDVIPDFLYIDGPDPATVKGEVNGQSWSAGARIVMSADLLAIEPCLMPGALVLIDGRTLNARFLASHLCRNWSVRRNQDTDVTVMELQEMPLGELNRKVMEYQLGKNINNWIEPLNR